MKLNLIGNKKDREYAINQGYKTKGKLINTLKKFGQVADYMPESMVADLYGVGKKTIEQIANRNKKELETYGYKVYKRKEILNLQNVGLENIPNRGLRLYPVEAVVIIGMMLTESKVAEELRKEIINELFGDPHDRIDKIETEIIPKIGIKKVESINMTNLMKAHLGINKIEEAKEEYLMLKEIILIHFQVCKFEDIPKILNTMPEIKKCFDYFDKIYSESPKQIGWDI